MADRIPAQLGSPRKVDDVFGILSVSGWHNIVHIATGVLGLAAHAATAVTDRPRPATT